MKPTLTLSKLELPVGPLGEESCVPDLMGEKVLQNQLTFDLDEYSEIYQGYGKVNGSYPYRQYNTYTRTLSRETVDTAVLENRYLKATFLPGYGGRLWSLVDKTTGKNLLYTNDVLRFSNLAVRNAWFSGGVEWNIGIIGHSPFTTAPLYTARLEENGVPVLRMYEYERIRNVYFQMDFWLGEGDRFLNCRMKIINEGSQVVPMYWWSNIAVPEYVNGRVVVPAEKAYTPKAMCVYKTDIPMVDGVDVTAYNQIKTSTDYFFEIPRENPKYIANLDASGYGLLQMSTSRLQSRKLFSWGNQPASDHWQAFLTEKGGRYLEIQAGLPKTQYGCLPMAPCTVWEWVEQYGGVQIDAALIDASHRQRYEAISAQLAEAHCVENMERLMKDTIPMSRRKGELIWQGSGYGALVTQGRLSSHLQFCCTDQGSKDWAEFLETRRLHCPDPNLRPDCFLADEESFRLLRETVDSSNRTNWYAHYQLGVRLLRQEAYEEAEQELLASLALEKNAWAYHALACLTYNRGEYGQSIAYMQAGVAMQPKELSYLKSAFKLLTEAEGFSAVLEIYERLDAQMQDNSRLKFYYINALHKTGNHEKAFKWIQDPEDFLLEDIREGEDSIAQLWLDVTGALGMDLAVPYEYDFKAYV